MPSEPAVKPRQRLANVDAMVARNDYRVVTPWMVVHDRLRAITTLRSPRGAERIEEQRLLDVRFSRPLEESP